MTGDLVKSIEVTGPWTEPDDWQQPGPAVFTREDAVYVSDPASKQIHLVDLAAWHGDRIGDAGADTRTSSVARSATTTTEQNSNPAEGTAPAGSAVSVRMLLRHTPGRQRIGVAEPGCFPFGNSRHR